MDLGASPGGYRPHHATFSRFERGGRSQYRRPVICCSACDDELDFPAPRPQVPAHVCHRVFEAGGEMERLRRILGHTTYSMVMRYVHLDKNDLGRDFDQRSPF